MSTRIEEARRAEPVIGSAAPAAGAAVGGDHAGDRPPARRMLARGGLVWLAYALLNLAVNGASLSELVTPAQIIAGAVRYPPGHPHEIAYVGLYSLLDYAAAGLWLLVPSAGFVSGVFNVLWLFLTGFVPYAATLVLTGAATWSFAAGALAVAGAALPFQGTYPMWSFPHYFTNGHVGTHAAVLAVALLLARQWRASGLLLGILPALHASMAAVAWPWAALFLAVDRTWRRPGARAFAAAFAAGLLICAALALMITVRSAGIGAAAPYDVAGPGDAIYRTFTAITDYHRHLFSPLSLGYGVGAAAFFGAILVMLLSSFAEDRRGAVEGARGVLLGVGAFGVLVWGCVYAMWLLRVAGVGMPTSVEILMPFRYSNLTALLLTPLALTLLWRQVDGARGERALAAALVTLSFAGLALVLLARDHWFVGRNVLYVLWALGLALAATRGSAATRVTAGATAAVIAALLAAAFPTPTVGAGFLLCFGLYAGVIVAGRAIGEGAWSRAGARARGRFGTLARGGSAAAAVVVFSALIAGLALPGRGAAGASQRTSSFDLELRAWLDRNASPQEPVLHAVTYEELQPRIGRPMLFHWTTLYLMTYMPELAPAINALARDFFGVDYARPSTIPDCRGPQGQVRCGAWLRAWPARSEREWLGLRARYGFRFVLSPADVRLQLPPVLEGQEWTLYEIRAPVR